jgi:SAM-dependent methyltransferase
MLSGIDGKILEHMVCPDCGGSLDSTEPATLRCAACRRTFPAKDGIAVLFRDDCDAEHLASEESLYAEMSRRAAAADRKSLHEWNRSKKEFIDFVLKSGRDWEGKVVGYLGCGVNTFEPELRDSGAIPVHMELVHSMLMSLRRRSATNLINCDAEHIPFSKATFDVILVIDLIHHFYAGGLSKPLREIARVLKPGGLAYIQEPNKLALLRLPLAIAPHCTRVVLRRFKHRLARGTHAPPADYEAPLIVSNIQFAEPTLSVTKRANVRTYPDAPVWFARSWSTVARLFPPLGKYFSYHWLVEMVKVSGGA